MKLFDSHCHLDDRSYKKDLDAVIQRCTAAGVAAVLIAGIDKASTLRAVELTATHEFAYASVGVHPHDAQTCDEATLDLFRDLARNPKVVAWGEIGLDFNRMYSPRAAQEKWLVRQLEAADDLQLPVIFHERDSGGRLLEILDAFPQPKQGVVHCFSGSREELNRYLEMGLYIGITGILTMRDRGAFLRELVPAIPLERLVIETDAPYLTPAPDRNRHRRNEPAFVKSVLLTLARVLNRAPEPLADLLWENTCRLFKLDGLQIDPFS